MAEARHIVEAEGIRGPRQPGTRLERLKLRASEGDLARDPVLAEFIRAPCPALAGRYIVRRAQQAEALQQHRNNTAYLFVGEGMDGMFVIAPADFPLLSARAPIKLPEVYRCARGWLNV